MRAVLLEAPDDLLEERRRRGVDVFDEVWEGVLHMVPPPTSKHQRFGTELVCLLNAAAKASGLLMSYETGVYRHPKDFRVPDVLAAPAESYGELGVATAAVVFEILSPNDETYEKLEFYAAVGVREVFVLEPTTRAIELFVLRGGKLHAALPDERGELRSVVLGVSFATGAGPKLVVTGAVSGEI